mmetsp:Transcript_31986/g.99483  ORF Transcript_31986/g.99483 Transcript_31986/m.99483 type:complete len:284 (+) Transcript_31986:77-928(+)
MVVIVKVDHGGDIRRLAVEEPVTFEQIAEKVAGAWPEVQGGGVLKYEDEEGDLCTLTASTMEDLLLVQLTNGTQQVLRLKLLARPAPAAAAPAPAASSSPPAAATGHAPELLRPIPEPSAPALPSNQAAPPAGTEGALAPPQPSAPAAAQPQAPPARPQRPAGFFTHFPIEIRQTHVVPHFGSQKEVSVHIFIWSVWPEGVGVVGSSWQANVSPWIPSAEIDIQLPADVQIRNLWSAEVVRRGEGGVHTLRLAPYPTTCFGGGFGLRGDPGTCTEHLVDALGG